ncbi:putative integral membrane protein [Serratia marcescens]|nr:putative integral membrane protein [Serratia marcescens]
MKLSKKYAVVVRKALDGWVGEGAMTPEQRQQLLQHVDVQPFDWRRLARYAFLAALASLLIAVTSLFADSELLAWLSGLFRFDAPVRMAIAGVLAALAYVWALRRRQRHPEKRYGNEAALFVAVLLTACALWQLGSGWITAAAGFPYCCWSPRCCTARSAGSAAPGWCGGSPCCRSAMPSAPRPATCPAGAPTGSA